MGKEVNRLQWSCTLGAIKKWSRGSHFKEQEPVDSGTLQIRLPSGYREVYDMTILHKPCLWNCQKKKKNPVPIFGISRAVQALRAQKRLRDGQRGGACGPGAWARTPADRLHPGHVSPTQASSELLGKGKTFRLHLDWRFRLSQFRVKKNVGSPEAGGPGNTQVHWCREHRRHAQCPL